MSSNVTAKQKAVYDFILHYHTENGYPPSIREICSGLGLKSTATVQGYINRLEKNGLLERKGDNKRRAICPVEYSNRPKLKNVPVVGKITAGEPILAIESHDEYVPLPHTLTRGLDEVFILNVRGDSMVEAGICDGDRIIVHRTPVANNGDIVAALIDDEATVKRFFKEDGHIRLQPENSAYEPIILDDVTILGTVIGLYRLF